jgi:hypothetical protein
MALIFFVSIIYLIEYFPVILFITFIITAYGFINNGTARFMELRGVPFRKRIFRGSFLLAIITSVLFSFLVNKILPDFANHFISSQKVQAAGSILKNHNSWLKSKKIIPFDNYMMYSDTMENRDEETYLRNVVFFRKYFSFGNIPSINSLVYCGQINLQENQVQVKNCFLQGLINTSVSKYIENQVLTKTDLEELLKKHDTDFKETAPDYFKFYLYSINDLLVMRNRISCPVDTSLYIFRRILYGLSFFIYSILGLYIVFYMEINFVQLLTALFVFAGLLPNLGNYLRLFDKYGMDIFSVTYLLPILGSIMLVFYHKYGHLLRNKFYRKFPSRKKLKQG